MFTNKDKNPKRMGYQLKGRNGRTYLPVFLIVDLKIICNLLANLEL